VARLDTVVVGIAGSLRRASLNKSLLRAAAASPPPGLRIDEATICGIPLFDEDAEAAGLPEPVRLLKERIASADGLLLVTPEYNDGVPGVMKNAIDWLSRPHDDVRRVFGGRAVAVLSATPGARGGHAAVAAWTPILRGLRMRLFEETFVLQSAAQAFGGDGALIGEPAGRLAAFLEAFAHFARRAAAEVQSGRRTIAPCSP
jgi:chromate reductase, NAD(P)H dehydrogenase (quinone)